MDLDFSLAFPFAVAVAALFVIPQGSASVFCLCRCPHGCPIHRSLIARGGNIALFLASLCPCSCLLRLCLSSRRDLLLFLPLLLSFSWPDQCRTGAPSIAVSS